MLEKYKKTKQDSVNKFVETDDIRRKKVDRKTSITNWRLVREVKERKEDVKRKRGKDRSNVTKRNKGKNV